MSGRIVEGQDDYLGCGQRILDFPGHFQTIHQRHLDVHQYQVRSLELGQRLPFRLFDLLQPDSQGSEPVLGSTKGFFRLFAIGYIKNNTVGIQTIPPAEGAE